MSRADQPDQPDQPDKNAKRRALAARRTLNPHPERVADKLFASNQFFDASDATQVKYEMLRRVQQDGQSVTAATHAFGVSRPTYYEAKEAFEAGGLQGLLPRKKGPQRAHKLSAEVMAFVAEQLRQEPELTPATLVPRIHERFGVQVHPRSVLRALERLPGKP